MVLEGNFNSCIVFQLLVFTLQKYITPTPKPKLSELAGISDEGITVKVVGDNGEEEHFELVGEQFLSEEVVHEDTQEYNCSTEDQRVEAEEVEVGE